MDISEVRITLHDGDKLRAFATVTLSNAIVIRGLKIIQGNQRMFVAMPTRPGSDGFQSDICHPLDRPTREWFEERVLAEYRRVSGEETVGAAAKRDGDGRSRVDPRYDLR